MAARIRWQRYQAVLLADAEDALELVRADALLGLDHEVDRQEPLPEGQLGIMERVPDPDAELVAAAVAIELARRAAILRDFVRAAARALHALRPANLFQVGVGICPRVNRSISFGRFMLAPSLWLVGATEGPPRMGRPRKKAHELTTEEAMRKLVFETRSKSGAERNRNKAA